MGLTGRITEIKWIENGKETAKNTSDSSVIRKKDKSWVRIAFSEKGVEVVSFSGTLSYMNGTNTAQDETVSSSRRIYVLAGKRMTLRVQFSPTIYPFTGYVAVSVSATIQTQKEIQTQLQTELQAE